MKLTRRHFGAAAMALAAAVSMASLASAADIKIALVVKSRGNGFLEANNKGAEESAKELGGVQIIYTGPTATTAEGQIEIINSLIAQGVDAIAISANELIGKMCMTLAKNHLADGKGDFAILFATTTFANQNTWIAEMKKQLKYFLGLNLATTVYGDDLADKSYREAQGLLKSQPNVKVIVAPTTVGVLAASQAVKDAVKIGQV